MMRSIAILLFSMSVMGNLCAQQSLKDKIIASGDLVDVNDKKFHWGVAFHSYWSDIKGETQAAYFIKPSIGGSIRAEYYFTKSVGVGIGVGFQQRGAGLNNVDMTGGAFSHPWVFTNINGQLVAGDVDSTYLERLRFSTIEVPLTLLLRTPHDVLQKGMRLSGAIGPMLIHTSRVNQTMQSVVEGLHTYNWVTDNYQRNLLGMQAAVGFDIDSGGGYSQFQVHLVYTTSFGNVYQSDTFTGTHVTYGVRIGYMF